MAALVVWASATGALATAQKPIPAVADNPIGIFSVDFTPRKLSETKPTPVTLGVSMNLRPRAEVQPPALTELVLRADRHTRLSVKGIPTVEEIPGCGSGRDPRRDSDAVRKDCAPALIGGGRIKVQIQFPEESPITTEGELLALNGGVKGGVTTLYLHTFLTVPTPAEIVTLVKIEKIRKGRYGWEAVATVPKIAGGSGSMTVFDLKLEKGIVSATCPSGRLDAYVAATFADGTRRAQPVVRTCTGRA